MESRHIHLRYERGKDQIDSLNPRPLIIHSAQNGVWKGSYLSGVREALRADKTIVRVTPNLPY